MKKERTPQKPKSIFSKKEKFVDEDKLFDKKLQKTQFKRRPKHKNNSSWDVSSYD